MSGFTTYVPGDMSLMSRDIGLTSGRGLAAVVAEAEPVGRGRSGDRRAGPGGGECAGMSRARVAVLKVVSGQLSVTAAAAEYGFSRRHLHRLLVRYREGGLEALEPRSRAPEDEPCATTEEVCERVIELRAQLTADGLDAGPVTIAWHLEREGLRAPATATIRRILNRAGLITPSRANAPVLLHPLRDRAAQRDVAVGLHPRRLADGTDVEILNWLDDHSRYLLSCTAHQPVTRRRRGHVPRNDRASTARPPAP